MQKEYLHLAYLLTKHECVTLPGFGAFVVQPASHSEVRISGSYPALAFSLSFNSELSHNDGLLVSSIQKEQQISYNEANLRVNRFVEDLSRKLHLQQEICIPGIGKLQLSEGRVVFSPDDFLTCNAANYGLADLFMPSLSDLIKVEQQADETILHPATPDVIWVPLNKRIFKVATSVAAAALLFFVFSTPLSNYRPNTQNAAVIPFQKEEVKEMEALTDDSLMENTLAENTLAENALTEDIPTTVVVPSANNANQATAAPQLSSRNYFVIIGSLPSKQAAQEQLKLIKPKFETADIVENGERFRIYVEKFSDKKEAESYMENFRSTYPSYKDAWLHSQK